MLCGSCIQPKKQLKVQIIGILEEIDSFYWPKTHLWKSDKNFGQGPSPPSFGQNPKEQQHFFVKPSLMIEVQHNAFGCFSSNMMQGGGRGGSQTDAIPTEMWNFFCGQSVYSQFTHNATSHSPFPPQFYYLQTIPMLDTSPPEMQFHKSYRGRCFMEWQTYRSLEVKIVK